MTGAQHIENAVSAEEIDIKDKTYQNFVQILSEDRVDELLHEKLEDIVINVIRCCFDPNSIKETFGIEVRLPEPQPPFFSVPTVLKIIKYIQV